MKVVIKDIKCECGEPLEIEDYKTTKCTCGREYCRDIRVEIVYIMTKQIGEDDG
jgi:hypothetical protein